MKKIPAKRSGDGAAQSTVSSWQYFDSLCFLRDQFTGRSSGGNLPNEMADTILNEDTETEVDDYEKSVNESQLPLENENISATTPGATLTKPSKVRKQQNDKDIGTALVRIEETKLKMLQNQQVRTVDEDSNFFDSLLPHVRTLPPRKKMLLRMKMQELVYNFVYGGESNPSQNQYQNSSEVLCSTPQEPMAYHVTELQTVSQEYSNPTSVASYLSNFSDETLH
ncbi:unnamed protein product [Acanthoscelides obtectus]|uniref:BESS domain-containing protein n=1 Tax=Acanthoscelides obtectus TaxID=200917 RepID=A0A9P0NYV6_ACAOB|nr:unnamed protein product [Acanthoscelides obtectus]CAK1663367.1 hypothetical protein AOBTE_LOCUS23635 [Acanthoscelides obtectus]